MSRRILIVDDEHDIRHAASMWLSSAGFQTLEATDGKRALSLASETKLDAIVLDIRMPGMDGLTVLSRLRRHSSTAEVPVVILSGSVVDRDRALDAGAAFFVTKPYQGQALVDTVQAAMECREQLDAGSRGCPVQPD